MDRKIPFGIIGLGGVAHGHAAAIIDHQNCELVAICDPNGEKALYEKNPTNIQFPKEMKVFTDLDEFFEKSGVEAVVIGSPDYVHCEQTVAALERGIHVMCEKPLAMTNEEAKRMTEAAKKSTARAFVGQICRFTPAFVKAKELIDSGVIGDVFCVESQYRHNCHEDLPEDNWRKVVPRHATACGGCHAIDIVRYLLDESPNEVFAFGNQFCRKDWQVEDCSETVMKFPSGAIGKVFTSLGVIAPYSMHTAIYGTKGSIITDNTWEKVELHTRNEETKEMIVEEIPMTVNNHNFYDQIDSMVRGILEDIEVRNELVEGARSLYVCNAAIRSMASGEKEIVDYSDLL